MSVHGAWRGMGVEGLGEGGSFAQCQTLMMVKQTGLSE